MKSRALIIAIENYAGASGMVAQTIDGAIESANRFREWVEQKWLTSQPEATELIFCSEPPQPGGRGAKSSDIYGAMRELQQHGQNMTDELFVYFHGHGFRFEDRPGEQMDILVPSDFAGLGIICIRLDEIARWLRAHLGGGGAHYYFINACRNIVRQRDLGGVGENVLPWNPNVTDKTSLFMIQSTTPGKQAAALSAFGEELRNGLAGRGSAKVWRESGAALEMQVNFSSLFDYLHKKMGDITQSSNGSRSATEAVIRVIDPPLTEMLEVEILGLPAGSGGKLTLTRLRDGEESEHDLEAHLSIPCVADRYRVRLAAQGVAFAPSDKMPADLSAEPRTLSFLAGANLPQLPDREPVERVPVDLDVPPNARIEIAGIDSGEIHRASSSIRLNLSPGRYESVLRSENGTTLRRTAVEVAAFEVDSDGARSDGGEIQRIKPGSWRGNAIQEEIAGRLPEEAKAENGEALSFSEALGWMDDPDPQLWLAVLGAGKILGTNGRYKKLTSFPLRDFSSMAAGESAVYVLAGFEDRNKQLQVRADWAGENEWKTPESPEGMPSLRQLLLKPTGKNGLVSFRIRDLEPVSIASAVLPNRVTLLVLTLDKTGAPVFDQFLLPLGHLIPAMDPEVQRLLETRNLLADVKLVSQASRAFRDRKELWDEFPSDQLDALLSAKWLDPMGACLAAYEKLRLRDTGLLEEAAHNLLRFFPELPDSAAIARMTGDFLKEESPGRQIAGPPPLHGIPLFFNGWMAVRNSMPKETWPKGDLDYSASLATWWGGV